MRSCPQLGEDIQGGFLGRYGGESVVQPEWDHLQRGEVASGDRAKRKKKRKKKRLTRMTVIHNAKVTATAGDRRETG